MARNPDSKSGLITRNPDTEATDNRTMERNADTNVVGEIIARNPDTEIAGEVNVTAPYPVNLRGLVTKGFGRGSKELGIPTANLPQFVAQQAECILETGIYFGWASVGTDKSAYPMVMSYGWNPFYKNEKRSAEVHIMKTFDNDFYEQELRISVLGFIRPEKNYDSIGIPCELFMPRRVNY